ncbi:MAG: hypothetical protein R3C20_07465 [Planctomycetaceae bacterium]
MRLPDAAQSGQRLRCPECGRVFAVKFETAPSLPSSPHALPIPSAQGEAAGFVASPADCSVRPACPVGDYKGDLFWKVDGRRASLKDFLLETKNPVKLLIMFLLLKILRLPLPASTDDPPVSDLAPFEGDLFDMPEKQTILFDQMADEMEDCGFDSSVTHMIEDGHCNSTIWWISMRHESGTSMGRVAVREWRANRPVSYHIGCSFISALDDGRYLVTTSMPPDASWPSTFELHRYPKSSPNELWNHHQTMLAPHEANIQTISSTDDLRELIAEHHAGLFDYHCRRGFFRPLKSEDQLRAKQPAIDRVIRIEALNQREAALERGETPPPMPISGAHADVVREIRRIQDKKSGWLSGIVLLAVSIGLFLGIGAANWSWRFAVMLLPIMFLHELGHYLTMRYFGYRNLRMFFIPLFGAAVTGVHYNIPSWKKVLVSLAGPVPGIAAGIGIGVAGLWFENELMGEIAMLMLILNGLNLIPVLPLDGGWVAHVLIFSRHWLADVAFRVIAAIALLGISAATGDKWLLFLGIFIGAGIPMVMRTGRVIHRLREFMPADLRNAAGDGDTVRPETADCILIEIDREFANQPLNIRTKAQLTLNIFEAVNSPPPNAGPTILLGGLHGMSLCAAVLSMLILVAAKHGDLFNMMSLATLQPEQSYDCGTSLEHRGPEADEIYLSPQSTLVATFADSETAGNVYSTLSASIPPNAVIRLFGQSILFASPASASDDRQQWISSLETAGGSVIVIDPEFPKSFTLTCIAPSEAEAERIQEVLGMYFMTGVARTRRLIPPWSPEFSIQPHQEAARRTINAINSQSGVGEDDADLASLQEELMRTYSEIRTATQLADSGRIEEIRKVQENLRKRMEERRMELVLQQPGVDQGTIELYQQQPQKNRFLEIEEPQESLPEASEPSGPEKLMTEIRAWNQKLEERMGALPVTPETEFAREFSLSCDGGYATRAGVLIRLDYVTLSSPVDGAVAISEWLGAKKCVDFKYQFGNQEDDDF